MNSYQNNDLRMPSGSEVESAAFHVHGPSCGCTSIATPVHDTSMKEKLNDLVSQGRMKLHDVQHTISEKTTVMKSSLQRNMALAKTNAQTSMMTARSTMQQRMNQANATVHTGLSDMQSDMKVNPMKWAGIAAGSGFAIGLIGRFMHWRNKHRNMGVMPQLVIIERSC